MKYFIRSVKYFFAFVFIFALFVVIMILTSKDATFANVFAQESTLFRANSLPKIICLFVAVAAIYPSLGFVKKEAVMGKGTFAENRNAIVGCFDNAGYVLENEDAEVLSFRAKSGFTRFNRMFEDRITITKDENPLILKGYRRDIFRLASAIEYATRDQDAEA